MEILAPAGDYEQGVSSIQAGANAVYGGLKIGNARVRAKNFTIEAYEKMLSYCRSRNAKFYLTLNILLSTDEVDEILQILKNITLPDAVIVADIGLILKIRELFPNLPIHASTQFGTMCIEDARFLETLGVKRAILARELSLEEVRHIAENSSLEIEVFVTGSQCVMFSGQCLWGGLMHGCSGNRGRCVGMCRDLYRSESAKEAGQYLYPHDLDAGGILKQLEACGVTSVKIEGRLRKPEITSRIITEVVNGASEDGYIGYLSGSIPIDGMFQPVHARTKHRSLQDQTFAAEDLLIEDGHFCSGIDTKRTTEYVRTVFAEALLENAINISLKLVWQDNTLEAIELVNTNGQRITYPMPKDSSLHATTVRETAEHLKKNIACHIYEIVSELPSNTEVRTPAVDAVIEQINAGSSGKSMLQDISCSVEVDRENVVLITNSVRDIFKAIDHGFRHFVYEIHSIADLKTAIGAIDEAIDMTYQLPLFDFHGNFGEICNLIGHKKVLLSRISQLYWVHSAHFEEIAMSYTCNVWNRYALDYIHAAGVKRLAVSPERSVQDYSHEIRKCGIQSYWFDIAKIPIGYTRACWGRTNLCGHQCEKGFCVTNISKGYSLQIVCGNSFGYRSVYKDSIDVAQRISPENSSLHYYWISSFSIEEKNKLIEDQKITIHNPHYIYGSDII